MKYYIIAGEASGDLHASNLVAEIKKKDKKAEFRGCGGDLMKAQGVELLKHYRTMAYMGFVEVAVNLRKALGNIALCKKDIIDYQPDALILVDYPGFNLHIAQFAKRHLPDTRVTYYIPPKIWAWKRWRVHSIGKYCDRILGIFPFEPDFYARYGYTCTYVGNPTAEAIADYTQATQPSNSEALKPSNSKASDSVALLPGSRRHEIENCLPKMLLAAEQAISDLPDIRTIVVTQAPGIEPQVYERLCADHPLVQLTTDTYAAVCSARAAIVNSGTATLETALLGCPQVAVYHLAFGHLLGLLRPIMFQIPHFTLVNIVAGREVIRELLAYEFTVEATRDELRRLLTDSNYVAAMQTGYQDVQRLLGTSRAAEAAAEQIIGKV